MDTEAKSDIEEVYASMDGFFNAVATKGFENLQVSVQNKLLEFKLKMDDLCKHAISASEGDIEKDEVEKIQEIDQEKGFEKGRERAQENKNKEQMQSTNGVQRQDKKKRKEEDEEMGKELEDCSRHIDQKLKSLKDKISSSSDDSCESSTSTSDKSKINTNQRAPGENRRKPRPNKKKMSSGRKALTHDDMMLKMLDRLDNRRMPQLETFNPDLEDFDQYLEKFEDYCVTNIKGEEKYWVVELEKHLDEETKEAYSSMRDRRDSYQTLKTKLLQWSRDMKDMRKKRTHEIFNSMKPKSEESLYLFSNRVEKQFRMAFPKVNGDKLQKSSTLRKKFLEATPKKFSEMIEDRIISNKVMGQSTKWDEIQKYARFTDLKKQVKDKNESERKQSKEITINVNAGEERKDYRKNDNYNQYRNENQFRSNLNYQNRNRNNFSNQKLETNNYHYRYGDGNYYQNRNQRTNEYQYENKKDTNYSSQKPNHQQNPRGETRNWNRNRSFDEGRNRREVEDKWRNNQTRDNTNIPQFSGSSNGFECTHCNRKGHTIEYCRRRLNLCLICGKKGHDLQQCYFNDNNRDEQFRQRNHEQKDQPKTASKPNLNY